MNRHMGLTARLISTIIAFVGATMNAVVPKVVKDIETVQGR